MPDDTAEQLELLLPETKRTRDKSDDELTPRQLYLRNWWRNHRDYSRQRRAEYRANNLEAVRASNRDWNRRNKDRLTISNARYAASPKGRYMTLINNAKLGGHELALTFDEWFEIASQDCTYCGETGLIGRSGYGIDRIDSSKGYTKENSAPCCWWCNGMKSDMDADIFLVHVVKIAAYLHKKTA